MAVQTITQGAHKMAEGSIKKLTEKGFGFINTGTGKDLFFHSSTVQVSASMTCARGKR